MGQLTQDFFFFFFETTIDPRLSSIYLVFILYPCPLNILFLLHYLIYF